MSGLLNGPFCQIAGAALETVCDHVPLGKVGFKALKAVKNGVINSQKLSEEEKIRLKYETIGAHIEGACKILRPAMELKNLLVPESKSADRTKPGVNPSANLHYYTPQKPSSQRRCEEGICPKDFLKETQFSQQKGRNSLQIKNVDSDSDSDLKSWKKCDACQAVSKSLIRTTCDHAICQKCVKSGKDCQKCLNSPTRIKNEPTQRLYLQIFDTD